MNPFWTGETYAIVKAIRAAGNKPGIVARWKADMERMANTAPDNADKQAVRAWLPLWKVRPFYTAWELSPIWPALAIVIGHSQRWPHVLKSAKRLEHELDYAKLPYVKWKGQRYYIVEQPHKWRNATEAEIKKVMR